MQRLDYEDSLEITDINDLLDYIYSLEGISEITKFDRNTLKQSLEEKMVDGIITIPKEYGMFICEK